MWHVCLYLVDRAYGGPEEGGWYYDTGEAIPYGMDTDGKTACRFFLSLPEARAFARSPEIAAALAELNEGRPSISSVLSEGRYEMNVGLGNPENYPAHKPRYE